MRFSQGVGFAFAVVATAGYALEWTTLGMVANALALVAALLNAAFGYCWAASCTWCCAGSGRVKQEAR
ncbi:DUF4395 family protein [Saccharopolyspora gregorii]|uniref:DUF4395 domain-containing protein n=1 Tax=Saccharopolyspora gregorii TaxID=33914 RepID=A0ABP6S366_9PSEU